MSPPRPRTRVNATDYHFHVYDYDGSSVPWGLSPGQPKHDNYQFHSMVQDLEGLFHYGKSAQVPRIQLTNVGQPLGTRGNPRYIQALSFGGLAETAPEVVITGGIHAREWMAAEMAYLLAEYLIANYSVAGTGLYGENISNLVTNRRIHIIPMLNPDGNVHSVFGQSGSNPDRLWRKNRRQFPSWAIGWTRLLKDGGGNVHPPFRAVTGDGYNACRYEAPVYAPPEVPPGAAAYRSYDLTGATGVDLNRNFNTDTWGYTCPPDNAEGSPILETYFGPERGSEVETRNVMAYLNSQCVNLQTAVDYHTFGRFIVYSGEAHHRARIDERYKKLGKLLQALIGPKLGANDEYKLGTSVDTMKYEATGTLCDYIATTRQARAFLIELDPEFGTGTAEGFMLPESQIQTVFEKNIRGALALIAAAKPNTWETSTSCFGRRSNFTAEVMSYQNWNVFGRGNRLPE